MNRPGNDAAYRPGGALFAFVLLVALLAVVALCVVGGFEFLLLLAGH